MEVFLGYRFTGENVRVLGHILGRVRESLQHGGHSVFCSYWMEEFFQQQRWGQEEILQYCFGELRKSDALLVFVKSWERSSGLEREVHQAQQMGKRIVLASPEGVQHPLQPSAHEVLRYSNFSQLYDRLRAFS